MVAQTDSAGDDGLGGVMDILEAVDPKYYAKQWPAGDTYASTHSMWGELSALWEMLKLCEQTDIVFVWVSDAASAVWSVNKGWARRGVNVDLLREEAVACFAETIKETL